MRKKTKPKTAKFYDVAVVDIGSNSVRLVIYRVRHNSHDPVLEKKSVCGLAREMSHASPKLHPQGRSRALKALRKFRRIIAKRKPQKIYAIGTAAMRMVAHTKAGR